jgi:hypothetical protein
MPMSSSSPRSQTALRLSNEGHPPSAVQLRSSDTARAALARGCRALASQEADGPGLIVPAPLSPPRGRGLSAVPSRSLQVAGGRIPCRLFNIPTKFARTLDRSGGGVWVVRRAPTSFAERSGLGTNSRNHHSPPYYGGNERRPAPRSASLGVTNE